MKGRFETVWVCSVAALLGCAGGQAEVKPTGDVAKPVEDRQAVKNVSHFDLATCFPRKPQLPESVSQEAIVGVLVAARPQVMECLVPQTARGQADNTDVMIKVSVSTNGPETTVSGENLTPEGEKCIRDALTPFVAEMKLPAPPAPKPAKKGAAAPPAPAAPEPVVGEAKFTHIKDRLPTVTLSFNEASDITGAVRLGMPQWCDCFAEWKDSPPRTLKAKVTVEHVDAPAATAAPTGDADAGAPASATASDGRVPPKEVVIDVTGDAKADKVGACLTEKMKALTFNNPPRKGASFSIPGMPLRFLHSGVSTPMMEGVEPDVRFLQLDALGGQRNADVAIALGSRAHAVRVYDELVKRYKAKPEWALVTQLENKCKELLKADDAWKQAVEALLENDKATLAVITELKAADPGYADAETKAQEKIAATEKDVEQAKATRAADEAACPKTKK